MGHRRTEEKIKLPAPPMADYEVQRAYRTTELELKILQSLFRATKGVFRPGPDDPKTWYGRAFRFIGLLFVYAALVIGVLVLIDIVRKGR
jgi:hypothetical protein